MDNPRLIPVRINSGINPETITRRRIRSSASPGKKISLTNDNQGASQKSSQTMIKLHRVATGQESGIPICDLRYLLSNLNPEIILSLIIGLAQFNPLNRSKRTRSSDQSDSQKKMGINPDILLIQSISLARKQEDLLPVALALRYQANPNLYTNLPGIGPLHIFGYTYQQLTDLADRPVLNSIIVMLYQSGSNPSLPAISDNGGGIRYQETRELSSEPSVNEWLETEGYPSILSSLDQKLTKVSPSLLIETGILLDRVDLISKGEDRLKSTRSHKTDQSDPCPPVESEGYKSKSNSKDDSLWPDVSLEYIIKSHSNKALNSLKNGQRGKTFYLSWENSNYWSFQDTSNNLFPLQFAIDHLNYLAFNFFLQAGAIPDYLTINQILIKYKEYKQNKNGVALTAISDMLDESIRNGVRIDPYQYNFLLQIDSSAAKRILEEYKEPDWKKICRLEMRCSSDNEMDTQVSSYDPAQTLEKLAFSLGLDHNRNPGGHRKDICKELFRISTSNPDQLNQAAIRRQVNRVATDVSNPEEYLKGTNQENLLCRNRALDKIRGKNPYAYNDSDLAFYRSRDGAVWCYTSDEFPDLLADQVNPITREPLPTKLLTEMKHKQNQTVTAGYPVRDPATPPITYQEALKKLNQVDSINNQENQLVEEKFFKLANLEGVDKDELGKLTRDHAESLLTDLFSSQGINQNGTLRRINLTELDPSYARMSFIRISYPIICNNPSLASSFFRRIKMIVGGI